MTEFWSLIFGLENQEEILFREVTLCIAPLFSVSSFILHTTFNFMKMFASIPSPFLLSSIIERSEWLAGSYDFAQADRDSIKSLEI